MHCHTLTQQRHAVSSNLFKLSGLTGIQNNQRVVLTEREMVKGTFKMFSMSAKQDKLKIIENKIR